MFLVANSNSSFYSHWSLSHSRHTSKVERYRGSERFQRMKDWKLFQKLPHKRLGSLVVTAVEVEVDVYKFLNILYESSREQERKSADNILSEALQAVTDYGEDSDSEDMDVMMNDTKVMNI